MAIADKLILWNVRCINRETRELFDRQLVFDPPEGADKSAVETALSAIESRTFDGVARDYRYLFRETADNEPLTPDEKIKSFNCFAVTEYFETLEGESIDEVELLSIMSGQADPVILGNPRSVLRLGPATMLDREAWDLQKSNDIAHFIQIVGLLQRSTWWRSGARLKKGPNTDALYALENPAIESTVAALALLRQFLLGRDDALKCATAAYLRHSGDDRRIEWIKAEIASFEAFLTGSPWQFGIESHAVVKDLTNRQLIETFIYGSGFFHRQSNKNLEDRLSELVAAVPREQLVFCFHGACRQLLRPAFVVAPVIYQDFAHWTNSGWCCRPTRVVVTRLFADSAPAASAVTP